MRQWMLRMACLSMALAFAIPVLAAEDKAFNKMDKNNDGKISLEEFKNSKKDAAKAEKMFKKLDKNNDGFLTKEELATKKKDA
jgi:Ca2+-binding EF-hand superfamily protein